MERIERPARAGVGGRGATVVVAVLAVAAAAWAAVVSLGAEPDPEHAAGVVVVVGWAAAAVAVALRRPGDAAGPLAPAGATAGGVAALAAAALHAAANGDAPGFPARETAEVLRAGALATLPALGLHLLLVVPRGALGTGGRRIAAGIGYAAAAGLAVAAVAQRPDLPAWPYAAAATLAVLAGVPAAAARYRRGGVAERRQVKWLGFGVTVAGAIAIATLALRALVTWPEDAGAVVLGASALIPIALALAATQRVAGAIDRLLEQTIALAGLASVVAAVYLAIVIGLGQVPTREERTLIVLSMIAAAVAALLYLPARARLQRLATRLVYGEREAPDEAIRTFGSRLSRAIPLDELLLQMAESLRRTLLLESAEVWTGSGGRFELSVADPDRRRGELLPINAAEEQVVARAGVSGPAWVKIWLPALLRDDLEQQIRVAPITHSGQLLGMIVVRRDPDRGAFDEEEERTLVELARQVGLALHNVRLDSALQASLDELRMQAEALQASRARIVAAADAERRRIERNLHDGAQQYLVALAVKVGLARQMLSADPPQANELLTELAGDVQETLDELRRLAHGIYPPLLADRGLAEALRSAAERSPVPTGVEASGIGRYSPELEAAVYFCCLEALQNVGKYGGEGARARVRVWEEEGGLLFEVSDDGAGFEVRSRKAGAGFTNMSDRVGAIGGSLRVESAPGQGTKVSGAIPIG